MDVAVGSTVWVFDGNHRVYRERKAGEFYGSGPIYREHFVARKVIGETRVSWVLDDGRKVTKKNLRTAAGFGVTPQVFTTQEQVDDQCWINDERFRIVRDLQACRDANVLRQIDALLQAEVGR